MKPRMLIVLTIGIIGCSWTLLYARYEYQLVDNIMTNSRFLSLIVLISLAVAYVLFLSVYNYFPKETRVHAKIYSMILLSGIYTVAISGVILAGNILLDKKGATIHKVRILQVYTTEEKSGKFKLPETKHWIVVPKVWLNSEAAHKISLSKKKYSDLSLRSGDEVLISVGDGAFGFQWIRISKVHSDK